MKTIKILQVLGFFLGFSLMISGQTESTNIGTGSGTQGDYNSFFGYEAGKVNTADYNTFLGHRSGAANTSGFDNVFLGTSAGGGNTTGFSNVMIGHYTGVLNATANNNTFVGFYTGRYNTGNYNVFFGSHSGEQNTVGYFNGFFGYKAGYSNLDGQENTFLGNYSGPLNTTGSNNTFVGYATGYSTVSGSGNIFLGNKAGYNETGSDKLYIDNTDTATPLVYGNFSSNQLGVNTNIIPTGYAFAVKGKMVAEELKVQVFPWADFVFEAGYQLPTLAEVVQHIKEKGHLKDIPSAAEVKKNGVSLGQMDAKLLQKIEELTLYTIQQEEKIKAQEKRLKQLENILLNKN